MARLTVNNNFDCKIDECQAEDWMKDIYGTSPEFDSDICSKCPFMKFINKLAEYENKEEGV